MRTERLEQAGAVTGKEQEVNVDDEQMEII